MLVMSSNYCKAILLLLLLAFLIQSGMTARHLPSDDASKGGIVETEKVNAATTLTTAAGHISHGNLNPNHPAIGYKHPGNPYPKRCSSHYIRCGPPDATP